MANFISGKKINLRGLRKEDLELYKSWCENPKATMYMETGFRPLNEAEMEGLYKISTGNNENIVFVIEEASTGHPIGIVGLYLLQWICRRAEFRILIGDHTKHGKGYGTEANVLLLDYAFNKLNMEIVYLGVNTENVGAVKSYERAGFQHEGTRRKMVYRNGRYYDLFMMSILRDEYKKNSAN